MLRRLGLGLLCGAVLLLTSGCHWLLWHHRPYTSHHHHYDGHRHHRYR